MNKIRFVTSLVLCWAIHCSAVTVSADEASEREFTLKVLPLLKSKCLGCHGEDASDIKGEFSVLSREDLLRGGESGEPSIVPGHPEQSPFVDAIAWEGLEMPPKENDRLTDEQIDVVRRWIKAGAVWPDEATQERYRAAAQLERVNEDGMILPTSGGTSAEWSNRRYQPADLWAFQPLNPPTDLESGQTPAQHIDALVDARLKAAELAPAPRADARTLIRRATFDLHGLPPTPEAVAAFEQAWAEDTQAAWRNLIDDLLDSPRYGERWARHWMDVTRYADTGGMANDYERSNLWRYRDYLIRSFNNDKPYDELIVEQLAGDELADASVRQRTQGNESAVQRARLEGDYNEQESEWLIATGFLRLGPWDNAMIEADEARQIYLDDIVNVTGQTFLSTTMRCCKCHDHKFDPIPTRDYYRLYAAFATTRMAERPAPFLPDENLEGFDEGRAHVQRLLDFATSEKQRLVNKREAAARKWFEEHNLPYKNENQRKNLPDEEKPPRHVGLSIPEQGQLKVREQDEWIWTRRLERYQPMVQSVYNAEGERMAWNGARKLRIQKTPKQAQPVVNYILTGGALTALGDVVQPGVLSALMLPTAQSSDDPYLLTTNSQGRRLGLANWIAHPDNPLTTRSIVNRIWQYHFGTGLAANANNFGAKGAKPTHPQLLDYLASDFIQHGWTLKRMHRNIMLSETYQRGSTPADLERVQTQDPNNQWLSYFPRRRLSAEELRDGILAITGELTHCGGGLPIHPEINMEVALQPRMIQFSLAPAYQPSPTPAERNRRTIYAYHVRGQADPFTELFNQPNPNESCEVRETAAVTPQAFTLLNSDTITDRSIAMALRLQREGETLEAQIERAFQLTLGRSASAEEKQILATYVRDMLPYHQQHPPQPVSYPTEITRSLVEEFSGDTFEYQEILPIFESYQADKKPSEVSAETRALADMCLLLLNTNEFMYVP
ncbi:PSD1 and planctomycete cytochrome C domain-containing protein [Roseimaritima ulvae]|uniref:Planctomycete cytochrome C n=1 Tax=Roseimaritima ulvae TaxID=980254 RepID=A0A5B9QLD6_9BACT|nr:PSD1 and planctomycete cytochrome C domain-containing protein [Roseimaritima ulvae]QEG39838.1 Planctomycete cytochrome C [Roseimaritima ulvae]